MIKRSAIIFIVIGILITLINSAIAIGQFESRNIEVEANTTKIVINSTELQTDNFIYNGTTYVPLRKLAEAMDMDVNWQGETRQIDIVSKEVFLPSTQNGEYLVSMINLIATPQIFNGKKVILEGWISFKYEGVAIYLHKDDYENGNSKNAIYLIYDRRSQFYSDTQKRLGTNFEKDLEGQYVTIWGTFQYKSEGNGSFGLYSGELVDISDIHQKPSVQ